MLKCNNWLTDSSSVYDDEIIVVYQFNYVQSELIISVVHPFHKWHSLLLQQNLRDQRSSKSSTLPTTASHCRGCHRNATGAVALSATSSKCMTCRNHWVTGQGWRSSDRATSWSHASNIWRRSGCTNSASAQRTRSALDRPLNSESPWFHEVN